MLPKRQRITREEFPTHTERRTKWVGRVLTIQYIHYKRSGKPKFSVVIPKKTVALASKRNQLRRFIYDAIRNSMDEFQKHGETKFIVTPLKTAEKLSKAQISADIESFTHPA